MKHRLFYQNIRFRDKTMFVDIGQRIIKILELTPEIINIKKSMCDAKKL